MESATNAYIYVLSWNGECQFSQGIDSQTIWNLRLKAKGKNKVTTDMNEHYPTNESERRMAALVRTAPTVELLVSYFSQLKEFAQSSSSDFTAGIHFIATTWLDLNQVPRIHGGIISHPTKLTPENLSDYAVSTMNRLALRSPIGEMPGDFLDEWKFHLE